MTVCRYAWRASQAVVLAMIGVVLMVALSPVIGNSGASKVFARRDTINGVRCIGANDGFIQSPFSAGARCLAFPARFFHHLKFCDVYHRQTEVA